MARGGPLKFKKAQIAEAIVDSLGLKARVIEALGTSYVTLNKYLVRWPELQTQLDIEESNGRHVCAGGLFEMVTQNRDLKVKLLACQFFLKTKGKDHGWSEKEDTKGDQQIHFHFDPRAANV